MTAALDETTAEVVRLVRAALDPGDETTPRTAVLGVDPESIAAMFHPQVADAGNVELIATGVGASPGVGSGRLVLSTEAALDAEDAGVPFIMALPTTSSEDVVGMRAAAGLITALGGVTSHAAVVARGWGTPAVVGAAELEFVDGGLIVGNRFVAEGSAVAVDGSAGEFFVGALTSRPVALPQEVEQLLEWADLFRGQLAVRANADTGSDAERARRLGAQGIGLCRTEHMFLTEDRLPLIRRFIVTDDSAEQDSLLAELEEAQVSDFTAVLSAMDGLPVTVRLLDPPLHEFLPDVGTLLVREASDSLDDAGRAEAAAARRMHESNPMLGTRGVRLGLTRPGLYQMQVRALCRAASGLAATGGTPQVEIMVPFLMGSRELAAARSWIRTELAQLGTVLDPVAIRIGAMVETPRMALIAGSASRDADFFSFGTNDLTQLTFGFSRDDVEARLVPAYLSAGLLSANPFEQLDRSGVGRLVELACRAAREARPSIVLGICGEQAAHPSSADFVVRMALDYVTCSPFRVPSARLALAQAVILAEMSKAPQAPSPEQVEAPPAEGLADGPGCSSPDDLLEVLHAVVIKGFASRGAVVAISGRTAESVDAALGALGDLGHVRPIRSRGLWKATESGLDFHSAHLPRLLGPDAAGLRSDYASFVGLNLRVKALCTSWQTRSGTDDDDSSGALPQTLLDEFGDLHREACVVTTQFGMRLARLGRYTGRLTTAAARIMAGESMMLTGVMCDSYHDIWMELHEDLVQLLGIDRMAEGSF